MKLSSKQLAQLAVMVALLIASALVTIPLRPVPITFQDAFVVLTALLFGGHAYIAVLAYLLLGLVGLPVFAGGASGMVTFSGPTGGFLLGFLLVAVVIGPLAARQERASSVRSIALAEASLVLIYVPGVLWMCHVLALRGATTHAALLALIPVAAVDIAKMAVTGLLVQPLRSALHEEQEAV